MVVAVNDNDVDQTAIVPVDVVLPITADAACDINLMSLSILILLKATSILILMKARSRLTSCLFHLPVDSVVIVVVGGGDATARGHAKFWHAHPDLVGSSFFGVWHAPGMFYLVISHQNSKKRNAQTLLTKGLSIMLYVNM
jgi:hypothetical protein